MRIFCFIFCLIIGLISIPPAAAQLDIAVHWHQPSYTGELDQQLDVLQESGVDFLIIRGRVDTRLLNQVWARGFQVIVDPGFRYIHAGLFTDESFASDAEEYLRRLLDLYGAYDNTTGVLFCTHCHTSNPHVESHLLNLITLQQQLEPALSSYLIAKHLPAAFTGVHLIADHAIDQTLEAGGRSVFHHLNDEPNLIRNLQSSLINYKNLQYSKVVFDSGDFFHFAQADPNFTPLLYEYSTSAQPAFPNPPPVSEISRPNWPVIILILTWFSFLIHFRFFPNYRRSVFRYFFNFSFFLPDILERHLRFGKTAMTMLLQTSILYGLAGMTAVHFVLSEPGFEALAFHQPLFSNPGLSFLTFFILSLGFNLISILWLSAAGFRTDIFSISATLIAWPQQLVLVLVTIMVTLWASGAAPIVAGMLFLLTLIVPIAAFLVSAFGLSMRPTLRVSLHHLCTTVLFIIVVSAAGALIWLLTDLRPVFELVTWLSCE